MCVCVYIPVTPAPSSQADLKRTRADVEVFRSSAWRLALKHLLQQFCLSHRIQVGAALGDQSTAEQITAQQSREEEHSRQSRAEHSLTLS